MLRGMISYNDEEESDIYGDIYGDIYASVREEDDNNNESEVQETEEMEDEGEEYSETENNDQELVLAENYSPDRVLEYGFDGIFYTVKIKAGTYLFHGSGSLADNLILFPVGRDFYDSYQYGTGQRHKGIAPNNSALTNKRVDSILSQQFNISPSWYGTLETARSYSLEASENGYPACQNNCIHVYQTNKDIQVIDISDTRNLSILINKFSNDIVQGYEPKRSFKWYLRNMIGLDADREEIITATTTFNRISDLVYDIPFGTWICKQLPTMIQRFYAERKIYDGYAAPNLGSTFHTREIGDIRVPEFHSEVVLCNPLNYMIRDYEHPADWQYDSVDYNYLPPELLNVMLEMMKYKSTNIDFHAGDLWEHIIWTLLNTEDLLFTNPYGFRLRDDWGRLTAIAAFLHDIGKMGNAISEGYRGHLFVQSADKITYFSVPDHPRLGENYMLGLTPFGYYTDNGRGNAYYDLSTPLNINNLLRDLEIIVNSRTKTIVTFLISGHWELGNVVRKVNEYVQTRYRSSKLTKALYERMNRDDIKNIRQYIDNYIIFCFNTLRKIESVIGLDDLFSLPSQKNNRFIPLVNSLMLLSIADVRSSQPPGVGRMKIERNRDNLNLFSQSLNFISNKSKVYRGGNMFDYAGYGPNETGGIVVKLVNERLDSFAMR